MTMRSDPKITEARGKDRTCPTCLYMNRDGDTFTADKCFRFARFVDHVLNKGTRDCDYWEPTA